MIVSSWISRAVALLLLMVPIAVLQLFIGSPLINSFVDSRESIAKSQATLEQLRHLASSRQEVEARLQEFKARHKSEGSLLKAQSVELAGAALQSHLRQLLEANGAELDSMQLLPVREEEGFRRISVSFSFRATMNSLQPVLYAVETQVPYLFVQKLELRSLRRLMSTVRSSTDDQSEELRVQLEVYGYQWIEQQ